MVKNDVLRSPTISDGPRGLHRRLKGNYSSFIIMFVILSTMIVRTWLSAYTCDYASWGRWELQSLKAEGQQVADT